MGFNPAFKALIHRLQRSFSVYIWLSFYQTTHY